MFRDLVSFEPKSEKNLVRSFSSLEPLGIQLDNGLDFVSFYCRVAICSPARDKLSARMHNAMLIHVQSWLTLGAVGEM